MEMALAGILGWEEGAVYRYNNSFLKIKHGLLLSSLTGEEDDWWVDSTVKLNDVFFLKEAFKVEPKKYYLKHKYLRKKGTNYLGLNRDYNCLDVAYPDEGEFRKTKFTEEDIEKIEATGFDLTNFERIEVEED